MSDLDKGRLVAERLGLKASFTRPLMNMLAEYYSAPDVHEALADAVEVRSFEKQGWHEPGWHSTKGQDTHSAYLIGVKPLAQEDEATRLLREFVGAFENGYAVTCGPREIQVNKAEDALMRARAHLARKGQT